MLNEQCACHKTQQTIIWMGMQLFFLYINKNVYFCKSKMPPFRDVSGDIIIEQTINYTY